LIYKEGTAKETGADNPEPGFSTSSKYFPAQLICIVAMIWVELLRAVDIALRKPKLSQGGFTQATASDEKFVPVIMISWLKAASPDGWEFQVTLPPSMDVIAGRGLETVTVANVADGATEGTAKEAGADNPPPGCGFSTSSE
jgi:hypothetical protein